MSIMYVQEWALQGFITDIWKGYPQEWFPSVSATIGDRYPERSVFQFFIAITSGKLPNLRKNSIINVNWPSRTSLCPGISLVYTYRTSKHGTSEDCGGCRRLSDAFMWGLDICHFY